MDVILSPSSVKGAITAPASKSAMQRACAAALLRGGKTILHNWGMSADDKAALNIIQQLGASVSLGKDGVIIQSNGIMPTSKEIDCGESGLSARMFTSIATVCKEPIIVNGQGSLLKRPFYFFSEVLKQLEVECKSNNGLLPLFIKGPLKPKNIEIDGSLSSQFLTGLLFAYSAAKANDKTIIVHELVSKPYIDLTLQVMKDFGLSVPINNNYKSFYFSCEPINKSNSDPLNYFVEGDWSGGAFLLVAGAIAGDVIIKGLNILSTQADKAILEALIQCEAIMSVEEKQIHVQKSDLKSFHFNATDCPDLFPPLVALAAYCEGTSVIEGVHRLTYKESNRAITLQQEFAKMEVEILLQDDLMMIKGGESIKGAGVNSHHDHRIAMACAIAALGAEGDTVIEEAEAVNKSYPQFWTHLHYLKP